MERGKRAVLRLRERVAYTLSTAKGTTIEYMSFG